MQCLYNASFPPLSDEEAFTLSINWNQLCKSLLASASHSASMSTFNNSRILSLKIVRWPAIFFLYQYYILLLQCSPPYFASHLLWRCSVTIPTRSLSSFLTYHIAEKWCINARWHDKCKHMYAKIYYEQFFYMQNVNIWAVLSAQQVRHLCEILHHIKLWQSLLCSTSCYS